MRSTAGIVTASIVLVVSTAVVRIQSQSPTGSTSTSRLLTQAIWNGDLATVKRLLASGADPLRKDEQGPPPFLAPWEVSVLAGNNDALRLLLEKVPTLPKGDDRGDRRLATAAGMNNIVATRELLRRGLPVDIPTLDGSGGSALLIASEGGHVSVMELLINAGANVRLQDKHGDSSLMAAVRIGSLDAVNLLLKHRADPNQQDTAGRTALIWAARTGREDIVRVLLDAGADIDAADNSGHTAVIAAAEKGHGAIVRLLRANGAGEGETVSTRSSPLTPRAAVEKSIPLLQRGAVTWLERARCGACHHVPMMRRVVALARERGFTIDEAMAAARGQGRGLGRGGRGRRGAGLSDDPQALDNEPDPPPAFDLAWVNHLLAEAGVARDATRENAALTIANRQLDDGRWNPGPPRVPISGSFFVVTAAAARVLQAYGPASHGQDIAEHIARAKRWLVANQPKDTHDEVFRMLGLHWTGADARLVRRAADVLKRQQNADGGWTQLPGRNSDAYATGVVLVALHQAAGLPVSDPVYRRGVDYLLRNQEPDGSWLIHKRAVPQNPYFESGFPHGKFQFISYAGSCWATMALIYAAGV
jgi:ankyrin repeat protein